MSDAETTESVGVVVLTYESDAALLERCLRSVLSAWATGPTAGGIPIADIVVVDNHSPTCEGQTRELTHRLGRETGAPLRFVNLADNYGFSGGINRGIEALDPRVTMVFLLNPDAEVEVDAIGRCAKALSDAPLTTVSAAPKMLLSASTANTADQPSERPVIDAVANAINERGEAFNVGLGQPDIGQYDHPKPCFGPCFGAALIRRRAFSASEVGPLNDSLFMYYEDVEWNWRAQILGFDSQTVPSARVTHVMSASTRDRPYDFKFRLTERNLLMVVIIGVPGWSALRIVLRRMIGLLLGSVKGHYPVAGLRAVIGVIRRLPELLRRRYALQKRRKRSHEAILAFGIGERTFFDAVRYKPTDRVEALAFAERRLRESQENSPADTALFEEPLANGQ